MSRSLYHFNNEYLLQNILSFQWLEDSLTLGEKTSEDSYCLKLALEKGNELSQPSEAVSTEAAKGYNSDDKDDEASSWKKTRTSKFLEVTCVDDKRGTSSLERNYLITPEHQLAVINGTDNKRTTVRVSMDPSSPARGSDAEMSSQTVSDSSYKEVRFNKCHLKPICMDLFCTRSAVPKIVNMLSLRLQMNFLCIHSSHQWGVDAFLIHYNVNEFCFVF